MSVNLETRPVSLDTPQAMNIVTVDTEKCSCNSAHMSTHNAMCKYCWKKSQDNSKT